MDKQSLFEIVHAHTGDLVTDADKKSFAASTSWGMGLCASDNLAFALAANGTILLLDQCGNYRATPPGMFFVMDLGSTY